MKKIKYLSIEDVDWAHNRILEVTGGERGDLARANLEFVLESVKTIAPDLDNEQMIVKKAAFILHSLVTQHPFVNGNKRTGFEVTKMFLEPNGCTLTASKDDSYIFLLSVSKGEADLAHVEDWIATNLAKKLRLSR